MHTKNHAPDRQPGKQYSTKGKNKCTSLYLGRKKASGEREKQVGTRTHRLLPVTGSHLDSKLVLSHWVWYILKREPTEFITGLVMGQREIHIATIRVGIGPRWTYHSMYTLLNI